MAGRRLCGEREAMALGYLGADHARRREVLRETLRALHTPETRASYHQRAQENLARWARERQGEGPEQLVEVRAGDWGVVTAALTRQFGTCFAVLNMANAHVPGGGYVEGAVAQEENIFRRTDCHFSITDAEYDAEEECYHPEMTTLLSAGGGSVYLDTEHPRVCIRGPEDRSREDLGYPWLADDALFPFFELRASAVDLRDGSPFDPREMRRRIAAQLDTLHSRGVRHVVLGAFGCGAFRNPATEVARLYKEELAARAGWLSVVVFAVFSAGYGPDNLGPFREVFHQS